MHTAMPETPATQLRKVDQLLAHYGASHQNPRNEAIHFIAIPLIMLSLCGLMYAAHPWLAYAFIAASMVYYARLSLVYFSTFDGLRSKQRRKYSEYRRQLRKRDKPRRAYPISRRRYSRT